MPDKRGATNGKPAPKTRLFMVLFSVLLVGVLCLCSAFYVIYSAVNRQKDVFYDGVYVADIHLGGMTPSEARGTLNSLEQNLLTNWHVELQYQSNVKTIQAKDVGLRLNIEEQLNAAWAVARDGSMMERWNTVNHLKQTPYTIEAGILFEQEKLDHILQSVQDGLTSDPMDAEVAFDAEQGGFTFRQEKHGSRLDIEPVRAQIEQSIKTLTSTAVLLQPEVIVPNRTVTALQGERSLIVSAKTTISKNSEEGRNENIRRGLEKINGYVIQAGDSFSFNKVVGKRTEKNGFQQALEIEYGEYKVGFGGGICQVSTTLYQAALRAGLKIEKREPHAIPANYCEMGQDATVADNGPDFVFRNNTDAPVYIVARMEVASDKAKTKTCIVELHGKPLADGIRYEIETVKLRSDFEADEPVIRRVNAEMYADEKEKEVAKRRLGYEVETYLVQIAGDGSVLSRVYIDRDLYKPRGKIIEYGTKLRD